MQSLLQALITLLAADSELAGLAGQAVTPVYLSRAPEGAVLPFVILDVAPAAPTDHDFPGARISHSHMRIICEAAALSAALSMAQRVVTLLDQTTLTLGTGILLNSAELHPPQPQLAATGPAGGEIYRVHADFVFSVFTPPGS